jgi:hypothetical protein
LTPVELVTSTTGVSAMLKGTHVMSAVQAIANRRRQRSRAMQAELDGRELVEKPRKTTPAFIEPAQLKPSLHMSDEPPFWFAVWNVRYNVAYALDAYP